MNKKKLVILGTGGHAKVILDIALKCGYNVLGFLDDYKENENIAGYSIIGRTEDMLTYDKDTEFIIAIGSNSVRKKINLAYQNINWAILIHPSAIIGMEVVIGKGTVVMANAVINPFARIGEHCIINTACVVEHDNVIEDFVHISPSAVLAGTVCVGEETHIGVGAVVRNNINIGAKCTIGAGGVVVKDISEKGVYAGVPVRRIG